MLSEILILAPELDHSVQDRSQWNTVSSYARERVPGNSHQGKLVSTQIH